MQCKKNWWTAKWFGRAQGATTILPTAPLDQRTTLFFDG